MGLGTAQELVDFLRKHPRKAGWTVPELRAKLNTPTHIGVNSDYIYRAYHQDFIRRVGDNKNKYVYFYNASVENKLLLQRESERRGTKRPAKPTARTNECGHPQHPHHAHGMCQVCYHKARQQGKLQRGDESDEDDDSDDSDSTSTEEDSSSSSSSSSSGDGSTEEDEGAEAELPVQRQLLNWLRDHDRPRGWTFVEINEAFRPVGELGARAVQCVCVCARACMCVCVCEV
eukprot:COSAG01_NODE_2550_length_7464_cov_14.290699_9_plen_231_part_00